jgi:hypothetical protein
MRADERRFPAWCLSGMLIAAAVAPATAGPPAPDPFASCREQLRAKPQDYESAYCFFTVSGRPGLWAEGKRIFEELIRQQPDNLWLSLAFGHVLRDRDPDAAERLYRAAAEGFRRRGQPDGEFLARSSLRNFLYPKGRVAEANAQMARVAELAGAIHDPVLQAQVWILQASHIQDGGGDLGVAYRLLKDAERALFPDGPYRQKRICLTWLGLVAFSMGRQDEAVELFTRLDALARAEGDQQTQASAQFNLLNTLSLKESLLPTPGARQRMLTLAERTLAAGLAVDNQQVVLKTRRAVAALLANDPERQEEALRQLNACVELGQTLRQPLDEAACEWLRAAVLQSRDPAAARAAQVRALRATEKANSPVADAYSASRHMQFSWHAKPRAEAIRDSLVAIDAIETLRSLQDDETSSAELLSNWTLEYYWLSGRLLQHATAADVDAAFSITERMRARSLLDVLNRSRQRPDPALPALAGRKALLKELSAVQRQLMDPTLPANTRQAALDRLDELESRDRETERQIALAARTRNAAPSFATLEALQAALADDEALLSFQIGIRETYEGEFGGSAWLVVVTRRGPSVYEIPDRSHFAPIVPMFTGLLAAPHAVEAVPAARLYHDVFGDALEGLPAAVNKLIVIPDGPLVQLPFEALRPAPGAAPIASRYEIAVAPSATLWLHWRETAAEPSARRALVLADPELDHSLSSDASARQAMLQQGLRVGRLPYARQESRAIERHLGDVDVMIGPSASEAVLKARDPQQYALLHFAAHAVSDEARPERSAVLLSAGSDAEDGLLQAREIQQLDLRGRIVVLSACETAAGPLLNGEGVLSLARAFFEAGARTVIGTRWPIRDRDAAMLFDRFYGELGAGASLSGALARAEREAIAERLPAAAWSSVILLGDGAARPFATRAPAPPAPRRIAGLLAAVIVLAAGTLLVGRRLVRGSRRG